MADNPMDGAIKQEVTENVATDGDVASFHNMMQGDQVTSGGRFDPEDRGFGSGIDQPNYQDPGLRARIDEPETRPTRGEAQFMDPTEPPPEAPTEGSQDWKQLYGKSENEKGEWRRRAQEADERVQKLEKEFESMRAGFGPGQPNYAQPAQPQQPQRVDWNQVRFLDKDPEDAVTAEEVNQVLRLAAQDLETIRIQQGQMAVQQLDAQKAAAGITPVVEQQIYQANPWLGNVPPEQRVQALVSLKQNADAAAQAAQAGQQRQAAPIQQAPPQVPQQVVQRPLHIESSTGRAVSETQVPLEQRIEQELAEAKARGGSKAMERVFQKYYGVGKVNDWGPEFLIG